MSRPPETYAAISIAGWRVGREPTLCEHLAGGFASSSSEAMRGIPVAALPAVVRVVYSMRKRAGTRLLRAAAAALCLLVAARTSAFHSGGVGECDGCHIMHGPPASAVQPGGYLLRAGDASSVCLNCHQNTGDVGPTTSHVSTADANMPPGVPPKQLPPGGDFGWLKKTWTWRTPTGTAMSRGEQHGHNIVAADYGYVSDMRNATAPGGTYPSSNLSCVSCHDPHGRYRRLADGTIATSGLPIFGSGSQADGVDPISGVSAVGVYRMLGGASYKPKSLSGAFGFANQAPTAVAPADYNRSEAVTQTRVSYGQGMSDWCLNCHPRMVSSGATAGMGRMGGTFTAPGHPVGNGAAITGAMLLNYGAYVRTGKLTGIASRAYLSLVPFEEGRYDYPTLKSHARSDDSYLQGPDSVSTVSCITCHRAHASGFDSILRYRAKGDFITVGSSASGARWPDPNTEPAVAEGRTPAETQASYYGRPASTFTPFQRLLCNKCHAKD